MDDLRLTRRGSLLRLGGFFAAALGVGGLRLGSADGAGPDAVASGQLTCVLSPEQTEGPYYIDGEKLRRNTGAGSARPATRTTSSLPRAASVRFWVFARAVATTSPRSPWAFTARRFRTPRSEPARVYDGRMCRNIHTLFNFEPPATDDEVRDASLQYVRKISGFTKPSQANEEAFALAVDEVADATRRLIDALVTNAAPKDREVEAERKRARAAERFATAS
jgi:hypothetical protein